MKTKTTITLNQAISIVGEDSKYYSYLVVKECECGDFMVMHSFKLADLMDSIDTTTLPVTRIDDYYESFIFVDETYVCNECHNKYEFPERLAAYRSFINYLCNNIYHIEVPKFYIDEFNSRKDAAGSFRRADYSVIIPVRSLSYEPDIITNILVHELRHAWQSVYHESILDYPASQNYYDRACEKDAYNFTNLYQDVIVDRYLSNWALSSDDHIYNEDYIFSWEFTEEEYDKVDRGLEMTTGIFNKDLYLAKLDWLTK